MGYEHVFQPYAYYLRPFSRRGRFKADPFLKIYHILFHFMHMLQLWRNGRLLIDFCVRACKSKDSSERKLTQKILVRILQSFLQNFAFFRENELSKKCEIYFLLSSFPLPLKEWTYFMCCNYFLPLNGFLSKPLWKCKIYLFLFPSWFPIYVIINKLGLFQQCQLIKGKISRFSLQTSILNTLPPYLEKLYINIEKKIFRDKQKFLLSLKNISITKHLFISATKNIK